LGFCHFFCGENCYWIKFSASGLMNVDVSFVINKWMGYAFETYILLLFLHTPNIPKSKWDNTKRHKCLIIIFGKNLVCGIMGMHGYSIKILNCDYIHTIFTSA